MAKTIATVLGIGFLLAGLLGFIAPGVLGLHTSVAHNLVHIVSGAVALYFGLAGTLAGARMFDLVFGAVYLLLGVVGFLLGAEGTPSAGMPGMSPDGHLFKLLPGTLEFGTPDHIVHILLGLLFLIGGLLTKADLDRAVD
ncbi:MAG: DUF4383 domain-containing protein [Pyrinomonadaceae bacterium]